jgi:hypothetical protein
MLMRTSKALAMLAASERRYDRLLTEAADERQRLLDRIMVLAERPMPYDPPPRPPEPESDFVDMAEFNDDDDLFLAPRNGRHV